MIILNGQQLTTKDRNKRYPQLDNLDLLFKYLQRQCVEHLARDLGVPANSIRWRVHRYFTDEMKSKMVWLKKPHKKGKNRQI